MNLKLAAIVFALVFLVIGILGFVPNLAPNGMLLGIFHVNFAHSLVHLLSGSAALLCGISSNHACRLYFRILGLVYGIVAALGFVQGDGLLLGLISNNLADTWLHLVIAVTSLALGFAVPQRVLHRV